MPADEFWSLGATPGLSTYGQREGASSDVHVFPTPLRDQTFNVRTDYLIGPLFRRSFPSGLNGDGWPSSVDVRLDAYFAVDIDGDGVPETLFNLEPNVLENGRFGEPPTFLYVFHGSALNLQRELTEDPVSVFAHIRLLRFDASNTQDILFDAADARLAPQLHAYDWKSVRFVRVDGALYAIEDRTSELRGIWNGGAAHVGPLDLRPDQNLVVPTLVVSDIVRRGRRIDRRIDCEFMSRFALWNGLDGEQDVSFRELLERVAN